MALESGFKHDFCVKVQALGWWPNEQYQALADHLGRIVKAR
jgi:hypothetical protein